MANLDSQILMTLAQINKSMAEIMRLLKVIRQEGLRVVTQESHLP